jgi:hypothetical protein
VLLSPQVLRHLGAGAEKPPASTYFPDGFVIFGQRTTLNCGAGFSYLGAQ